MKKIRIFSLVACFVMTLFFLTFSFPGASEAVETPEKKCIKACAEQKQTCLNINADQRVCEVEFQSCLKTCEPKKEPAPTQSQDNSSSNQSQDKAPLTPR